MSDLPTIALVLLTYGGSAERREYAYTTLHSALDNLRYSGRMIVHIADDGSPEEHRRVLAEIAGGYAHVDVVGVTDAERGGYGRNYNLATQAVHESAELVLCLEDDWTLGWPLDLDWLVQALVDDDELGCIRLGYIGFVKKNGLLGALRHVAGGTYLVFDEASEDPHVWTGHPRLETTAFQQRLGPWPEGLSPGATEFEVCNRPAARRGVAWPMDILGATLFGHIGEVRSTD